jgi:hypothetical protein
MPGRLHSFVIFIAGAAAASIPALACAADEVPHSAETSQTKIYFVPKDTEIHLRLLEAVASNTHERGTKFKLEVAEPLVLDAALIVPAGSQAYGEVIHAAKPGMGGKPAELIVTARTLRIGQREVALRSFTAAIGDNRREFGMVAAGVALGPGALFIVGKNVVIPIGTHVYAKIAKDLQIPAAVAMEPGNSDAAAAPAAILEIEDEAPRPQA